MATASTCGGSSTKPIKPNKRYCCVPMCNSDGRYDNDISFHHIPKDETIKKRWIIKIKRDEGPLFQILRSTVVCSKHFTKDDYSGYGPRNKLKKDAVPSVFDWSGDKTPRITFKRKLIVTPESSNSKKLREGVHVEESEIENDIEYTAIPLQKHYEQKIEEMQKKLNQKTTACNLINKQLNLERFVVSRFSKDDKLILFYTGVISYSVFESFYECIEPQAKTMLSKYNESGEVISLAGRKRNMLLIDELFMFLCRLRVGLLEQDLSVRFNCSLPTISRTIVTWANFLYVVLGTISIWLPRNDIDELMPDCFKELYPNTRVIIDYTEIKTQQPSSLVLNSQMYSSYKSSCTFKCLLGIAPHGTVTFVSPLYTGCMSDVEITKLSGLLDLLEPGDSVMADKGFTIRKLLDERSVGLNIPPFLSSKTNFFKSRNSRNRTNCQITNTHRTCKS